MGDKYNYGPAEHELAGGTFGPNCVDECETYLRNTGQGSVCGLRQKRRGDFEGTLLESERANTNAHQHEYATDMFGSDLTKTDSFGTPVQSAARCALCQGEKHPRTRLCDRCWELTTRIEEAPELARKILAEVDAKNRALESGR